MDSLITPKCKWCKDTRLYYPLVGEPIPCDQCSSINGHFIIIISHFRRVIVSPELIYVGFSFWGREFEIVRYDTVSYDGPTYEKADRNYGSKLPHHKFFKDVVFLVDSNGRNYEFPFFENNQKYFMPGMKHLQLNDGNIRLW